MSVAERRVRKPAQLDPLGPGDLVLSDFDGTISLVDTGVEVIMRLRLAEAWELEERWRHGEIGSRECLAGQWALVRMGEPELLSLLDAIPLDETFVEFVNLCRERQADLAVLSDGLDLYVNRMLARLGLRACPGRVPLPPLSECLPTFANHGEWTDDGVRVTFPLTTRLCDACGNCKRAHLAALRPGHRRVIYIGDGYSDMCAAEHADVRFARNHLADFCQEQGLDYRPFACFAEVAAALRG